MTTIWSESNSSVGLENFGALSRVAVEFDSLSLLSRKAGVCVRAMTRRHVCPKLGLPSFLPPHTHNFPFICYVVHDSFFRSLSRRYDMFNK